jgi:hypothetical protein
MDEFTQNKGVWLTMAGYWKLTDSWFKEVYIFFILIYISQNK